MPPKLKNPRLERELGTNELRDYLASKRETSTISHPVRRPTDLRPYRRGLASGPRILLIAPGITIPRNMPKRCIPPLGLCYLAAAAELAGFEVAIYDCCVEGYEHEEQTNGLVTYGVAIKDLPSKLRGFDPDVIGVSVLFSTDLEYALKICRCCKALFREIPIVLGGLHPTIYPREVFDLGAGLNGGLPCFDFIIRGEGEHRLAQFIQLLQQGCVDRNADGLAGVLDGELFFNPQIETIQNLNEIPFPAYHLVPMEKYFEINVPFSPAPRGKRVCQILSSRGCPVSCTFCASTNLYKQYRFRSVENVISEITQLRRTFRIDEIQFADDNLTFSRDHTLELMTALQQVGLPWCTPNGTMVNTLSPALLGSMAAAGLYQITLSIDSGSVKTLTNLHHKPVKLQNVPDLIATCRNLGIWTHGTLVVGMPGETLDDLNEGFRNVLENFPFDSLSTFIASPIPGSELYHQALDRGLVAQETAALINTTKAVMLSSEIRADTLERLTFEFQEEFTRRAMNRNPDEYNDRYGRLRTCSAFTESYGGRLT